MYYHITKLVSIKVQDYITKLVKPTLGINNKAHTAKIAGNKKWTDVEVRRKLASPSFSCGARKRRSTGTGVHCLKIYMHFSKNVELVTNFDTFLL